MLGDSVVLTVLGQVAFMPVLVLAAKLCPEVRPCAGLMMGRDTHRCWYMARGLSHLWGVPACCAQPQPRYVLRLCHLGACLSLFSQHRHGAHDAASSHMTVVSVIVLSSHA